LNADPRKLCGEEMMEPRLNEMKLDDGTQQDVERSDAMETLAVRQRVQNCEGVQGKLEEAFSAYGDRPCLGTPDAASGGEGNNDMSTSFNFVTFKWVVRRCAFDSSLLLLPA